MTAKRNNNRYRITLYLDTPKSMMNPLRDPLKHSQLVSLLSGNGFDVAAVTGHAYIGLAENPMTEERWGYGPESANPVKLIRGVPGTLVEHEGCDPYNEAITWNISKKQYLAAKKAVEDLQKDPGEYKLFEKNCATVACQILRAANVPDLPTGKTALTPFGLVLKKRLMLAKRRIEMLKFKTKNVVNALFGRKKAPSSKLLESFRSKPMPVSLNIGTRASHVDAAVGKTRPPDNDRILHNLTQSR